MFSVVYFLIAETQAWQGRPPSHTLSAFCNLTMTVVSHRHLEMATNSRSILLRGLLPSLRLLSPPSFHKHSPCFILRSQPISRLVVYIADRCRHLPLPSC